MAEKLWLIRHGETAWTLTGAHTGLTDLPLLPAGETKAGEIREKLAGQKFSLVLSSPLARALKTAELAGLCAAGGILIEPRLVEWNYGDYEGMTTAQIRQGRPGWDLFRDGVPNGETAEEVAVRARAVIARALAADGPVALVAHGHVLRVLTACWLGLEPAGGRYFALGTASVSTLGYEHETRVIRRWNLG